MQGQLGAAESKLSEHVSDAVNSKQREQQAREALVAAEAVKKHAEARIATLEGDLVALKSDKTQIHSLMTQVKSMHEEDAKRYAEDLARLNRDCERKEKDWTDARTELAKERTRVDEMRLTSEHKLSELRSAVRIAEQEASDLRTEKIRLDADVKAATDRAALLERQLESAETRFRDALAYQQRAAEVASSPGAGAGATVPTAAEGGAAPAAAAGSEELSLMSSRLITLESENASLQKQLQELQMHRNNWQTMATQNEEALRELRKDLETRGANAEQERQKLEALLAEKTQQLTAAEDAALQRQTKAGEVQRELDALKQQVDMRESGLRNSISQLELERNGLKDRLKMVEEEAGRLDELRKQALTDYEREVSQHAAKLDEMRKARADLAEAEERSRQAVAAAEEARVAKVREAAAEAEAKRVLDGKVKELESKVRDLEELNALFESQLQHHDKAKEARLAAMTGGDSPWKGGGAADGGAPAMGEEDTDTDKQLREAWEHLRRLKTKKEMAECLLKDTETELAREKQRAEQHRRELGELRARLEVGCSRGRRSARVIVWVKRVCMLACLRVERVKVDLSKHVCVYAISVICSANTGGRVTELQRPQQPARIPRAAGAGKDFEGLQGEQRSVAHRDGSCA